LRTDHCVTSIELYLSYIIVITKKVAVINTARRQKYSDRTEMACCWKGEILLSWVL